jgi:hypothetical protein
MVQKYIVGDVVKYDNKIMVIKEPRDGNHFDLSCPTEGLVYCLVDFDEIKPVELTPEILEKNGWEHNDDVYFKEYHQRKLVIMDGEAFIINESCRLFLCNVEFVHQLQHLLFGLGLNHEMEV